MEIDQVWLEGRFTKIEDKIDMLPCAERGELLAVIKARYENGIEGKKAKRDYVRIGMMVSMFVLAAITVYCNFFQGR